MEEQVVDRVLTVYEQVPARYHDVVALLRQRGDEIVRGSFEGDLVEEPPAVAIELGGFELQRHVEVEVGEVAPFGTRTVRLPFSWHATQHAERFPTVDAALEVTAMSDHPPMVELALFGTYHLPFGLVGTIADGLTGHHVVEAIAKRLVARVSDHIEQELSRTASLVD